MHCITPPAPYPSGLTADILYNYITNNLDGIAGKVAVYKGVKKEEKRDYNNLFLGRDKGEELGKVKVPDINKFGTH